MFNFRPSVRPVPLQVHINGFPGKHYCPRMATMNKPTFGAIRTHSPDKPTLIFVSSRRQTRLTALDLIAYLASENDPKQWLHMPEEEVIMKYLTSSHLFSPSLPSSHLPSLYLTFSPHLPSSHLTFPHLTSPSFISPHLPSSHFTSLYLTLPHLFSSPSLILPHLPSSHLTFLHLTSPHLPSSHLTFPHLTLPSLISPHLPSSHLTFPHLTSPSLIFSHFTFPRVTSPRLPSTHVPSPHLMSLPSPPLTSHHCSGRVLRLLISLQCLFISRSYCYNFFLDCKPYFWFKRRKSSSHLVFWHRYSSRRIT